MHVLHGVIDDLYQKNARFSKLKLFFSIRSIRLGTVLIIDHVSPQASPRHACSRISFTCLISQRQTINPIQRRYEIALSAAVNYVACLSLALLFIHSHSPPPLSLSLSLPPALSLFPSLSFHLQGIGSSAQGLMNAILFCACTPIVRKNLSSFFKRTICWPCRKKFPKFYALSNSPQASAHEMEDTTDCDERGTDPNDYHALVVNSDPFDSEPKSHLLSDNSPVTFNYQSMRIASSVGED